MPAFDMEVIKGRPFSQFEISSFCSNDVPQKERTRLASNPIPIWVYLPCVPDLAPCGGRAWEVMSTKNDSTSTTHIAKTAGWRKRFNGKAFKKRATRPPSWVCEHMGRVIE